MAGAALVEREDRDIVLVGGLTNVVVERVNEARGRSRQAVLVAAEDWVEQRKNGLLRDGACKPITAKRPDLAEMRKLLGS